MQPPQPIYGPAYRPPMVPQYYNPPMPNPYVYYQPGPTTYFPPSTPKPPPGLGGLDYMKPVQATAKTNGDYFTGDPLYTNATVAKEKGTCFDDTGMNSCVCRFECQNPVKELPKVPEMKPTTKLEKEDDDKPAWIVKLEKIRDMVSIKEGFWPSESMRGLIFGVLDQRGKRIARYGLRSNHSSHR